MSYSEVRSYLTSKDIPKLFTSLMAGLMYNRPEDHLKYLQSCLDQAQSGNVGKLQWNTFIEPKRPKSRELPPLPHRRPSSEAGNPVPTVTPLPPINSHYILEGIYDRDGTRQSEEKKRPYPDVSYSLYHVRENVRPTSAGFRTTVLFVVGAIDEDVESLCSELVDGVDQTAQHGAVRRLMSERMLVEGFSHLDSVPACALVDEIQRYVVNSSSDVVVVSGFPRHEKDALEWESWDLPIPDLFYVEDVALIDKLAVKVERGEMRQVEKDRLANKNNDLLSVVDYLKSKYPDIVNRGDNVDRLKEIVRDASDLQSHREIKREYLDLEEGFPEPSAPPAPPDFTLLKEAHLPIICFVGVPGAGKSSQSASSGHKYDLTRLSLKELVEEEMKKPTDRAEILKLADLDLLDSDLAVEILKEAMNETYSETKGFILDGFPQTVEQGEKMEEDIGEFKAIVNLQATSQVAVNRLIIRVTDQGMSEEDAESVCKSENEKATEQIQSVLNHFHLKVITVASNGSAAEVFENVSHILEGVLEIPEEPAEVEEPECVKEEVKEEVEATKSDSLLDKIPPEDHSVANEDGIEGTMAREIENQIEEASLIADDTEAENIPLDSEVASEPEGVAEEVEEAESDSPVCESEKLEGEESEEIKEETVEESAAETNQTGHEDDNDVGGDKESVGEEVPKTESEKEEISPDNQEEKIDSVGEETRPSEDAPADPDQETNRSNDESLEEIKPVLEVFRDDLKSTTE